MKKIIFLTLLTIPFFTFSQTITDAIDKYKIEGENVIFSKIIEPINGNKDEIFPRAITYIATSYKSANDVIQQQDKDAGIIIVKGNYKLFDNGTNRWYAPHTLRIDIKDNRARIMITTDKYVLYSGSTINLSISGTEVMIVSQFPVFDGKPNFTQRTNRKLYTERFDEMCDIIEKSIISIEEALHINNTELSDDDW